MKYLPLVVLALATFATGASAQTAGNLQIEQPFSRATPNGAKVGGGYMTIINKGNAADTLVSVSSPAADHVEIHEMSMQGSVMKMQELPKGLPIDAGKTVALAPGGYHLMMMGLKAPLKEGDKVPVTLTFEKAGKVDVTLDVRGVGAQAPAPAMNKMQMAPGHKM